MELESRAEKRRQKDFARYDETLGISHLFCSFSFFFFFFSILFDFRLKCVFHFRSHIQTHWHSSTFSLGSL